MKMAGKTLICSSAHAGGGVVDEIDVRTGFLQGIDETERGSLGILGRAVPDCFFDILSGMRPRNDGLGPHGWRRPLPVTPRFFLTVT